jgi:hypothetical protein
MTDQTGRLHQQVDLLLFPFLQDTAFELTRTTRAYLFVTASPNMDARLRASLESVSDSTRTDHEPQEAIDDLSTVIYIHFFSILQFIRAGFALVRSS